MPPGYSRRARRRSAAPIAVLAACASFLATSQSFAYDFEVSSRTVAYGYQVRRYGRDGLTLLDRRRFTQYLGLRVFNLLDDGRWASRKQGDRPPQLLYLNVLFRFFTDFGGYASPPLGIGELRENQFDLLLGALQGRNLGGYIDFTLGRQYDAELYDFFAYDGLRVRANTPWKAYVEGYFGLQVNRTRPLSYAVFETDGTSSEVDEDQTPLSPAFGVAVGIDDPGLFGARFAYRGVASRDDAPALGAAGTLAPLWGIDQELLFASADMVVPHLATQVNGGLRYNLLTGSFDETTVRVEQPVAEVHRLGFSLLRSRPHFDGDSIFNVFAVEPFDELAGTYRWRVIDPLLVQARGGYRLFWSDDKLEDDPAGALTLALAATLRLARLAATLDGFYLDSYAGRRYGGEVGGRWTSPRWVYGRRFTLEGRVSVVHFDDGVRDVDPLTTLGMQFGGSMRFLPGVRLHLLFENNISRIFRSALRVLAILDMRFRP